MSPPATAAPRRALLRWAVVLSFMLLSGAACARQGAQPVDANEVFSDPRVAELAAAVAAGDAAAVRTLAQAGVPLDAQGDKQVTLLQWALLNKSPRGMKALLEAGANPAQPGVDGDTVLHLAAMANDAQYLELLLAHGADPNARSAATQATPLASALRGKREVQLQALLTAGADPNAADRGGNTPLHQAAKYNDPVNALKLLEAGADPNARNVQDATFQQFLFTTREDVLSGEAKRGRERIRDWLRSHDVAIEDPGTR